MNILRNDALRRTAVGAIAGLALTFGVASMASADAYIDENGVPVATSGDTTVAIIDGQPVFLYGEEGAGEAEVLSAVAAEENSTSIDSSPALAVSDASGGEDNVSLNANGDDEE